MKILAMSAIVAAITFFSMFSAANEAAPDAVFGARRCEATNFAGRRFFGFTAGEAKGKCEAASARPGTCRVLCR